MAGSSKSSQKVKNVLIAILALWSIISLIIIVVWATSPDLKGAAQCRTELQEATEKLEGAKVVFAKDKAALEEMVEEAREERSRQQAAFLVLLGRLNATNASLEECQQQKALLNMNISALQQQVELHQQTEANLTTQLVLQEDHIENLEQNLTQAFHFTKSCFSLKEAAQNQMMAAESQTKACQSSQQYLQKQL
ncbi:uncharacterized protein si:ch211-1a19.3 isoform X2 [Thalassophryne amazonica]|nr:uncharacterized protein si:ch211-1a19.3 isoform X2 [Thalassophryne amazonica]